MSPKTPTLPDMRTVVPEPAMARPEPPTALDVLEARAAAPGQAAEAAGTAVRERMRGYPARAATALARLRTFEPDAMTQLRRVSQLETQDKLNEWQLQLGGSATVVSNVRRLVKLLRPAYETLIVGDRTVAPTTMLLAGIAGRVAKLEARDAHACPALCGCVLGMIRQHVEDGEAVALQVPATLTALAESLARLETALARRVDGVDHGVTVHRAPPSPGVTVTTETAPGISPPSPPGPRVVRDFDPLT